MAELKTKATKNSALKFLNSIKPEEKRTDGLTLLKLFKKGTGQQAVMWGTSIVGFGQFHYKSQKSSQEGDWPVISFSPRAQSLTLYILGGIKMDPLLAKLGKHKTSGGSMGGCLYINKLSDVNEKVLALLIKKSYVAKKKMYAKMFPK